MKEKESYSPEEVAEMCKSYHLVRGGFDSAVSMEVIKKYEETIPTNVRDIINNLHRLEEIARNEALSKETARETLRR